MQILFVADGYPTPDLPYSAFIKVICEELLRHGHCITVIAPQSITRHFLRNVPLAPRTSISKTNGEHNIVVYRPYFFSFGNGRLKRLSIWHAKVAALIEVRRRLLKPDICYAHFWHSAYNIVGWASSKKIPLFVATGEDKIEIQNALSSDELNLLREYVSGVICVSTKNKEE